MAGRNLTGLRRSDTSVAKLKKLPACIESLKVNGRNIRHKECCRPQLRQTGLRQQEQTT